MFIYQVNASEGSMNPGWLHRALCVLVWRTQFWSMYPSDQPQSLWFMALHVWPTPLKE